MLNIPNVAPARIINFCGNTYDFTRLIPRKNKVAYKDKTECVRDSIEIMRSCGYPFDFRCPMPPMFVHSHYELTWRTVAFCLYFVVDFANNYSFEPWNRHVKWLGHSFVLDYSSLSGSRLYNVSLRHRESDDIISSCVCSRDKLSSIIENFLDRGISYSYVQVY